MRILYILDGFPFPLTSGLLRHYHLIAGLAQRHEIDVLALVGAEYHDADAAGLEPFTRSIETFRSTARSPSRLRKVSRHIIDRVTAGGRDRAGRDLAASAERRLHRDHHDIAFMGGGRRTIAALERIGDTPVVVDLCDAGSARLVASLEFAPARRRAELRYRIRRAQGFERRLVAAGNHLLFASARDRDLVLGERTTPRSSILPNGVDLEYWHRSSQVLGDEIVFSGALHYPPNDDAARFLIGDVMPHVWAREPTARVRIVGRNPTPDLAELADGDSRITVTGFVDDVRPHLEHAAVYAAPLRFASGIQNKLLEAMSMELPLITTPVAAAGLEGDGVHPPLQVIEADPAPMAEAIVSALARARADRSPDHGARVFVSDHFRWDQAVDVLERALVETSGRAG